MTTTTTTTSTLLTVIRAAGCVGVPVLLWGTPGTGKTELIETIGRLDGLRTEVVIGSLREPADLNGLPVVQADGSVLLAPPRWARNLVDAGGGYLFLDELSTAPPAVQAAMLRVVKDRVVGDLTLPVDTRIIAAANPADVSAGGWELEAPTANRFLHVDHQPDFDVWIEGLTIGFDASTAQHDVGGTVEATGDDIARATAQVVGFLRAKPTLWNRCPSEPGAGGGAWPSPRTWHYLIQVLAHLPATDQDARMLAARGLVGQGAAIELLAWARHGDLPDPASVLDGHHQVDYADRDDRLFAVLTGLVTVANSRGTADAWDAAWDILAGAAANGRGDIAAAPARSLFRSRPDDAAIPAAVKEFAPLLRTAGMLA